MAAGCKRVIVAPKAAASIRKKKKLMTIATTVIANPPATLVLNIVPYRKLTITRAIVLPTIEKMTAAGRKVKLITSGMRKKMKPMKAANIDLRKVALLPTIILDAR